ncbi:hypothetical protein Hypma_003845 [Hypsizygus marmoreus]|uniref:G-protein coupled receptors family 3 profile domain-containing protein n=1 Tax=Hypsizygus marmoreus TaxID=39966 RepID=A0A369K0H1_HYPMA|nr:hypothetical protein Hypma_003845 [Hypsizygus marmoreus]
MLVPISSRQDPSEAEIHSRIAIAFIVLQLAGGFGLLVTLLTAIVSPSVKRYSTWYSFGTSWILSSISYSLLAIAGQRTGPKPAFGLCLAQSALIYAAPSLTACTTLALITHMLLNLRRLLANAPFRTNSGAVAALLIVPYIVWLAMFVGVLLYGLSNPDTVRRSLNGTYCDSTNSTMSKISSLIVMCCMVLIVGQQGVIGVRLYRNRRMLSGCGQVTMVARIMLFSLLGVLALGVAIAYVMTSKHGQVFDIILASLPVLAVFIFGSQLDILRIWMCRRRKSSSHEKLFTPHSKYSSVSTEESFS